MVALSPIYSPYLLHVLVASSFFFFFKIHDNHQCVDAFHYYSTIPKIIFNRHLKNNYYNFKHQDKLKDSNLQNKNPLPPITTTSIKLFFQDSSPLFGYDITQDQAEIIAGPFFASSLLPYLVFLYYLNVHQNTTPKSVVVGFTTCLLFVFLTIPAAIAAKIFYGVSLADSDWLHGSAESLLTITNIITVVGFRQALKDKKKERDDDSYRPMTVAVMSLTIIAALTACIPAIYFDAIHQVHFPYLGGFMELPSSLIKDLQPYTQIDEPINALTVECWIIHISSLVEFLIAMGFVWQWAEVTGNPKWKGLTWGLLPLHTSGIIACTYHLFYNQLPILVPLQAMMTLIGNTTAAFAAYRLAISNGWTWEHDVLKKLPYSSSPIVQSRLANVCLESLPIMEVKEERKQGETTQNIDDENKSSTWLLGFEDIGPAWATDTDISFVIKLFVGCTIASYVVKYGELFFDFPKDANILVALSIIFFSSALNAFKWWKRSQDPSFDSWL